MPFILGIYGEPGLQGNDFQHGIQRDFLRGHRQSRIGGNLVVHSNKHSTGPGDRLGRPVGWWKSRMSTSIVCRSSGVSGGMLENLPECKHLPDIAAWREPLKGLILFDRRRFLASGWEHAASEVSFSLTGFGSSDPFC